MINKKELEERYGLDPLEDGDVLQFKKCFRKGGPTYTYMAVRAQGNYFVTGNETKFGWFELMDFYEKDNVTTEEPVAVLAEEWDKLVAGL